MDDNLKVPFGGFREMHPLEMLAAVASETLENEKNVGKKTTKVSVVSSKIKFNSTTPLYKKSPIQTDQLTLKEIKLLSDKMLMEKFSEMTADELNKKYNYKCYLLPKKCVMTFQSYGNELKARAQMKAHLLTHLEQLSKSKVIAGNSDEVLFTARSTVIKKRKVQDKSKKKKTNLSKKWQNSVKQDLALILKKPSSVQKSAKHSELSSSSKRNILTVKMEKVKSRVQKHEKNSQSSKFNVLMSSIQIDDDIKLKSGEKLNGTSNGCDSKYDICDMEDKSLSSDDEEMESGFNDEVLSYYKRSSSFNFHLEQSHSIPVDKILEENFDVLGNNQEPKVFLHDHTYMVNRNKIDVAEIPECTMAKAKQKRELKRTVQKDLHIEKQFIIETPPFPFVYTPVLPHIAQIAELGDPLISKKVEVDSTIDHDDIKGDEEDDDDDDDEEEDSMLPGSVLECVENRVNLTEPDDDDMKSMYTMTENSDENSIISTQIAEKQLALKYIRTLRMKKKDELGSLTCQICKNKHFTAQATLMHHYRSHAGIKPYTCDICCATFTRQHSLNYHMLIHNNLSRFSCEDCGRMFRHPSHYKEHLRRHTGETPFHCLECHLQFKTRNTYKRHLKTRHGKLLTAQGIKQLTAEEFLSLRGSSKPSKEKQHIL